MWDIQLKERRVEVLSKLEFSATFKIPEHSFIFMKMEVEGLSVLIKQQPTTDNPKPDPKPVKVHVPDGKVPVVCLNTGKAQFLNLNEKVQIVELEAKEVIREKGE